MKILHIGNIANNAYLNAKILNDKKIESDVLSCDYYHIMGCPEWENADFSGNYIDDNNPSWHNIDLNGFTREKWFINGDKKLSLKYLIAKKSGNKIKCLLYKLLLDAKKMVVEKNESKTIIALLKIRSVFIRFAKLLISLFNNTKYVLTKTRRRKLLISPFLIIFIPLLPFYLLIKYKQKKQKNEITIFKNNIKELKDLFFKMQPSRKEYFDENYFFQFQNEYSLWKKLFSYYDLVHAYGLDGIYPLLANVPYVVFEHGTIRNFPFQNDMQGISCYLSYKCADGVFITNADNIKAAEIMELNNKVFIPHPINENALKVINYNTYENLYEKYDSNFIVFHPPRQHWTDSRGKNWKDGIEHFQDWEKGNDIFIRGFAQFVKNKNKKAKAIFVLWGKKINESKALIKELNIEENIIWVKPMHNIKMIKTIMSCDLLVDQFTLGAFGSTMPKALMCKKPAMMYLNEDLHNWCLNELPPVLNCKQDSEVYKSLCLLYSDKEFKKDIIEKSYNWYCEYHSNKKIYETLIDMYKKVLDVK